MVEDMHRTFTVNAKFRCLLLTAFFFAATVCSAQKKYWTEKDNAVSFEVGKSGLIYNLTFDHRFTGRKFGFIVGAGSSISKYVKVIKVGGGPYVLVGQNRSLLEMGIDVQYLNVDEESDDQRNTMVYPNYSVKSYYATFNLGYRYTSSSNLFRIGISPGFIKDDFVPGAYVSFGILF